MADSVTRNLSQNFSKIQEIQNRISTGKKILTPSDDPIGIGDVMEFQKKIALVDQYEKNIQWGRSWLNATDGSLDAVDTLLTRAKELAVYQASETASTQTRSITAEEVTNIFDQMIHIANASLGGRHLFAGHQTDTIPYTKDNDYNVTYAGDAGDIKIVVGENMDMVVNTIGSDVFDGAVDVFGVLKALKDGLENNDTDAITSQIEQLDDALKQVQNHRAKVGARLNRLEASESYWQTFKLNTQDMLYKIEDADLITSMTELKAMETAYQAALAATASIIQPSLLQFLR